MGSVQIKDLTSVQAAIALPPARTNANAAGAIFMPPSAYAHRRGPAGSKLIGEAEHISEVLSLQNGGRSQPHPILAGLPSPVCPNIVFGTHTRSSSPYPLNIAGGLVMLGDISSDVLERHALVVHFSENANTLES